MDKRICAFYFLPASGGLRRPLTNFTNYFDPDEAPQTMGPHLRSKFFDTQIISKNYEWQQWIFVIFERKENWRNLVSMQIVKFNECRELYRSIRSECKLSKRVISQRDVKQKSHNTDLILLKMASRFSFYIFVNLICRQESGYLGN